MKLTKQALACCILGFVVIVSAIEDQDDQDNPDIEAQEAAAAAEGSNSRSTAPSPGPWFDRIMGLIHSKNFRGVYKKYLDNMRQPDSDDDTSFGELSRRDFSPGPVKEVYVKDARTKHHHHHHHQHHDRHHDHHKQKTKVKKWANIKIVNQVGTRVKIKANKILPSTVLSSGEIFVYHRLLNGNDRKAKITLKAIDEYTDKPLTINGESKLTVTPTTYDGTQEAYVYREDSRGGILHARHGHIVKSLGSGNRWFYVKLINHAGGHARIVPDQILPATTLNVDESQVEYARLEPGDEYKRIVLRAFDVKNEEPLKLNGEFTLALRPDDAGDVARVKITRGDTIYAKCDNFVSLPEGEMPFEYQISTDDTKSWFDAVRSCKLCDAELLSVHTHEENDFITKQLHKASEVNKLWIGMSYLEQKRMWSWIDGSRYRYQNWKEGQHYDGKDEQCGIMYQRYDWGRWDDDNCYKPLGYICKRHRTRIESKNSTSSVKRGCPNILPECPSLCRIVKVPGSCSKCDCGQLVKVNGYEIERRGLGTRLLAIHSTSFPVSSLLSYVIDDDIAGERGPWERGYDTMSANERSRVRGLFSDANHQMHEARRARFSRIKLAHAMRRSRIMQEAGRLMAESRNLREMADMEGIPLRMAYRRAPLRRQEISKPESGASLAREIVSLMSNIEKAEKHQKSS